MKATIKTTGEAVEGKTLKEIRQKMNAMLKVEGPRALTAVTETGAVIHTEIYEGQDYIKASDGRVISK